MRAVGPSRSRVVDVTLMDGWDGSSQELLICQRDNMRVSVAEEEEARGSGIPSVERRITQTKLDGPARERFNPMFIRGNSYYSVQVQVHEYFVIRRGSCPPQENNRQTIGSRCLGLVSRLFPFVKILRESQLRVVVTHRL
jgi:hypothetical protein